MNCNYSFLPNMHITLLPLRITRVKRVKADPSPCGKGPLPWGPPQGDTVPVSITKWKSALGKRWRPADQELPDWSRSLRCDLV